MTKTDARAKVASLGKKDDDVPEALHNKFQKMAEGGLIPVTTPTARARARKCTSSFGVPVFFSQAKRYGYIGPNLPPPKGYKWETEDGL